MTSGSHNGTRLNGWLVRETVPVRAGDRLEFGSVAFIVQDDPPARATEQPAADNAYVATVTGSVQATVTAPSG